MKMILLELSRFHFIHHTSLLTKSDLAGFRKFIVIIGMFKSEIALCSYVTLHEFRDFFRRAWLGQALLMDNQPEDAVRELKLAVSLNPDSEPAHHLLGTALFQQQKLQAAEKEFREALRVNPSADNHYALAACLMSMDRYEEALSEVNLAANLDPERQLYRARREELMKLMKDRSSR